MRNYLDQLASLPDLAPVRAIVVVFATAFICGVAAADGAKSEFECKMCGGDLGVSCCCMKKKTEKEECGEARQWIRNHTRQSETDISKMDCTECRIVARISGWKSQDELKRDAEGARERAEATKNIDAETAKQQASTRTNLAKIKAKRDEEDARAKKYLDDRIKEIGELPSLDQGGPDQNKNTTKAQQKPQGNVAGSVIPSVSSKADSDLDQARDIFKKAEKIQKNVDDGVTLLQKNEGGVDGGGIVPAPSKSDADREFDKRIQEKARELISDAGPPRAPSDGNDPAMAQAARVAEELLRLSKKAPGSTSPPADSSASSPKSFDDLLGNGTPISRGDAVDAVKAGIDAYAAARGSGQAELPNARDEVLKKTAEALSPPTPADLAAQAVHQQAVDLQRLYGLAPASPEKSAAANLADDVMAWLPGSLAKSNVAGLTGLRDENVGLIETIHRAIDKLFHAGDYQDLLKN